MTKLFEPTLFLRDGKEWIKGFTMERPMQQLNEYNLPFAKKMKKFLASAVEYPVCEGSVDSIEKSIHDRAAKYGAEWTGNYPSEGIRIDELADRLEVVIDCKDCNLLPGLCYIHDSYSPPPKVIRLRPEVKEESQEDMWNEVIGLLDVSVSIRKIRFAKQQFKITRI